MFNSLPLIFVTPTFYASLTPLSHPSHTSLTPLSHLFRVFSASLLPESHRLPPDSHASLIALSSASHFSPQLSCSFSLLSRPPSLLLNASPTTLLSFSYLSNATPFLSNNDRLTLVSSLGKL